jgi:hypothetical protein
LFSFPFAFVIHEHYGSCKYFSTKKPGFLRAFHHERD